MGLRLSHYELVIRLAGGGGANVFLARDTRAAPPGRLVAVKVLLPALANIPEAVDAFFSEADIASRLRHPNIVGIDGFGEANGVYGLAMEYVFGDSLAQILNRSNAERKPLTVCVMLEVVSKICGALHYAHELADDDGAPMNLVHRDISPENVLLGFDGIPRLTDFGIAKVTNRGWETQAGIVKGKARYMSPEQLMDRKLDRRSDVFLLGIVLWEALTGRPLFKGSSVQDVLEGITTRPIDPPSVASPGLPPVVDAIVMRALRRPPSQRFTTAEEMRLAIDELLDKAGISIEPEAIARELGGLFGATVIERANVLRSALDGSVPDERIAEVLGGTVLDEQQLPRREMRPRQPVDLSRLFDILPPTTPKAVSQSDAQPAKTEMVLLDLESPTPRAAAITPESAADLNELMTLEPAVPNRPSSSVERRVTGWRDGETIDETTPLFLLPSAPPPPSRGKPSSRMPIPERGAETIVDVDEPPTHREMESVALDENETVEPMLDNPSGEVMLSVVRRYMEDSAGPETLPDTQLPPDLLARDPTPQLEPDTELPPGVASKSAPEVEPDTEPPLGLYDDRVLSDSSFQAIGPQAPGYAGLEDGGKTELDQPVTDTSGQPTVERDPIPAGPRLSWKSLLGLLMLVFAVGLVCGLVAAPVLGK